MEVVEGPAHLAIVRNAADVAVWRVDIVQLVAARRSAAWLLPMPIRHEGLASQSAHPECAFALNKTFVRLCQFALREVGTYRNNRDRPRSLSEHPRNAAVSVVVR